MNAPPLLDDAPPGTVPSSSPAARSRGRRSPPLGRRSAWLLVPVVATVLGLVDSAQVQYDRALGGEPITWGHALQHGLPRWYAWALLVPVVLWLTRRIDRAVPAAAGRFALHVVAGVAVTFVQVALFAVSSSLLHGGPDPLAHLRPAFQKYMGLTYLGGLVTYALLVAGWYAWNLYRRFRERERETARLGIQTAELKAHLAEARLRNLQSQLQPHFLFNALHALAGLVLEGEKEDAVRMTTLLSDLLRRSLRAAEAPEISLDEELRLIEDYLAIQRLRFDDRLTATVEADPDVRRARVPPLLLQPLVENAVRHGLEADPSAGRIAVRCHRRGGELVLAVEDDGPGPGGPAAPGGGVGLGNTRARLEGLHGGKAALTLEPLDGGGTRAEVRMPWRDADAPAPAGAEYAEGLSTDGPP